MTIVEKFVKWPYCTVKKLQTIKKMKFHHVMNKKKKSKSPVRIEVVILHRLIGWIIYCNYM